MSKNIMQMCADEIAGYLKRIAVLEKLLEVCQKEKLELRAELDKKQKDIDEINGEFLMVINERKDLKQQLSDIEEENETLRKALRGEIFINYKIPMENERLKQQLTEKEKLINEYADEHAMLQCKIADLAVKEIKAEDFAIEQIQKAWDMFSEEYFANEKMETLATRFLARLNQQIQELRGENV